MERAFQHAVDDAVKAYGIEGKGREKALRTLDSGYQKASAEISRICGEKQYVFILSVIKSFVFLASMSTRLLYSFKLSFS